MRTPNLTENTLRKARCRIPGCTGCSGGIGNSRTHIRRQA